VFKEIRTCTNNSLVCHQIMDLLIKCCEVVWFSRQHVNNDVA